MSTLCRISLLGEPVHTIIILPVPPIHDSGKALGMGPMREKLGQQVSKMLQTPKVDSTWDAVVVETGITVSLPRKLGHMSDL